MHIQLQQSKNLLRAKYFVFLLVTLMLILLLSRVWANEVVETSGILLSTLMLGITSVGIRLHKLESKNTIFASRLSFERGELKHLETEEGWCYLIEHYDCHKLFHDYIELKFVLVPDESELNHGMYERTKHKHLHIYADMLSHLDMSYLRRVCLYKNRARPQSIFGLQNTKY